MSGWQSIRGICAGLAMLALVLGVLGTPAPEAASKGGVSVSVVPTVASPGYDVVFRIRNQTSRAIGTGLSYRVERFDGTGWVLVYEAPHKKKLVVIKAHSMGSATVFTLSPEAQPGPYRVVEGYGVLKPPKGLPGPAKQVFGQFSVQSG